MVQKRMKVSERGRQKIYHSSSQVSDSLHFREYDSLHLLRPRCLPSAMLQRCLPELAENALVQGQTF